MDSSDEKRSTYPHSIQRGCRQKRTEPVALPAACLPPRGKIKNLRSYIRQIMSIEGQRGSDACFRVACILRDEGTTADEALQYMLEWNQELRDSPVDGEGTAPQDL